MPDNQRSSTLNGYEIAELDNAIRNAGPAMQALTGNALFLTGGTGFIGQWLLATMARANVTRKLGIRITVLTRSIARFTARCPELAADPAVCVVEGDVQFFDFPKGRFTYVLHGAADTTATAPPLQLMDTIVSGTRRVLDFSLAAGAERVLFLSSGAIYGPQPPELDLIPEHYAGACPTTDPRSAYGQAKRAAEQLGTIYHSEFGLKVIGARLFAFVGPGMPLDSHFAIGNFIRDAIAQRQIIVTGDGTPLRSYLYAGDLTAWLLRLLTAGRAGAAYNVGSCQAHTIAEIAALVARVIPGAAGYAVKGVPREHVFRARYIPAVTLARNELGLDVWTPLEEAVKSTARWAAQRTAEAPTDCAGRRLPATDV